MITVYTCYYREKLRLPALKSFQPIINLVFEFNNTIESSLRILYFTPNFTDMLFYPVLISRFPSLNVINIGGFTFTNISRVIIISTTPNEIFLPTSQNRFSFF